MNLTLYDQNIWGNFSRENAVANRNSVIRRLIEAHNADVCCFQECNPKTSRNAENDISALLAPVYAEAGNIAENFTPVYYRRERFELIEWGFHTFEGKNDLNSKSLTYAVLSEKVGGTRFGVISTHFWWESKSAEDDEQRVKNAETILEYVARLAEKFNIPIFAMGDLNCYEGSDVYKTLCHKLYDLRKIAAETTDTMTHHDYPIRGDDGLYRAANVKPVRTLDFIFANTQKSVLIERFSVDCSERALTSSDHCPLIAHISL